MDKTSFDRQVSDPARGFQEVKDVKDLGKGNGSTQVEELVPSVSDADVCSDDETSDLVHLSPACVYVKEGASHAFISKTFELRATGQKKGFQNAD